METEDLSGFEAKLRGLGSIITQAMHQNQIFTLNINFYEGANIGQHIDRTETSNVWMDHQGYMDYQKDEKQEAAPPNMETFKPAIDGCKDYFWSKSAFAIIFCVVREYYHYPDNMTQFEKELRKYGYDCPTGTIRSAIYNNDYLRYPIKTWEQKGAKKRVLMLVKTFREFMENDN